MFANIIKFDNVHVSSPASLSSFLFSKLSDDDKQFSYVALMNYDYELVAAVQLPGFELRNKSSNFSTVKEWVKDCSLRLANAADRLNKFDDTPYAVFVVFSDMQLSFRVNDAMGDVINNDYYRTDLQFIDRILIDDSAWRSTMCDDEDCCPADGSVIELFVDEEINPNIKTAEELFLAKDNVISIDMSKIVKQNYKERLKLIDSWKQQDFVDLDVEEFVVNMHDVRVRDGFLRSVLDLDHHEQVHVLKFVNNALSRVDSHDSVPVYAVSAGVALMVNEMDFAKAAVNVGSSIDPSYSLLRLLNRFLTVSNNASVWVSAVEATPLEECLGK